MKLTSNEKYPYLKYSVIEEFSDLIILSEDKQEYHFNKLLLLSWISIGFQHDYKKFIFNPLIMELRDCFVNCQDMIIASNLSSHELKVLSDFVMNGDLPCSQSDILNDRISDEDLSIFKCFGINLKVILKYVLKIPSEKIMPNVTKPSQITLKPIKSNKYNSSSEDDNQDNNYEDTSSVSESEAESDESEGDLETEKQKTSPSKSLTSPKSKPSTPSKSSRTLASLEGVLQCRFCDYTADKSSNIKIHALNHFRDQLIPLLPDIAPFECPECEHPSRDRITLLRHFAFTHGKVFDFATPEDFTPRSSPTKIRSSSNKASKKSARSIKKEKHDSDEEISTDSNTECDESEEEMTSEDNTTNPYADKNPKSLKRRRGPQGGPSKPNPFNCNICGKIFYYEQSLKDHFRECKQISELKCDSCKKTFDDQDKLQFHLKWSLCNKSKIKSDQSKSLQDSRLQGIKPLPPEEIQKQLKKHLPDDQVDNLLESCKSIKNWNGKIIFVPQKKDPKALPVKNDVKLEKQEIDESEPFVDDQDPLDQESYADQETESDKVCECPHCGKAFSRRFNLEDHVRAVHEKVKDIHCDFCDKTFARISDAKKHMKQACKGVEANKEAHLRKLERMKSVQSDQTPSKVSPQNLHECSECGKTFKLITSLKDHFKSVHEKLRDIPCEYCPRKFSTKPSATKHMERCKNKDDASRAIALMDDGSSRFYNPTDSEMEVDSDENDVKMDTDEKTIKKHDQNQESQKSDKDVQQDSDTRFQCNDCEKSFKSLRFLRYHEHDSRHGRDEAIPCTDCDLEFRNEITLNLHLRQVHKINPFRKRRPNNTETFCCELCGEKFNQKLKLRAHVKIVHPGPKPCPECGMEFNTFHELRPHRQAMHGVKTQAVQVMEQVVCNECGKLFTNIHGLTSHIKFYHGEDKKLPCDHCDQTFRTERQLAKHKKYIQLTPCEVCGEMMTAVKMKHHMMIWHTDDKLKPFVCEVCKKGFSSKYRYDRHKVVHTGEKPFVCHCGSAFGHKQNLRAHQRSTHEGIKRPPRNRI